MMKSTAKSSTKHEKMNKKTHFKKKLELRTNIFYRKVVGKIENDVLLSIGRRCSFRAWYNLGMPPAESPDCSAKWAM